MPPKVKFTKAQIISAAVRIVRAAGMPALTARAISAELNCSVAPIFSVFDNMETLCGAVIEEVKRIYAEYIREGLCQPIPFKGVGEQYIKFAVEQPRFFQLLFMSEHKVADINNLLPILDDNYEDILESVRKSYGLDGEYAEKMYKHLFIYTHGIATLCATGVYTFTADEMAKLMSEECMSLLKSLREQQND